MPLFIDESSEAKSPFERQALGKLVYQLGNGRGRTRGQKSAGTQAFRHWSTVILSSGEHPITTCTQDAGTRARVLSLEDSPFGAVNDTTAAHVRQLGTVTTAHHGHAGPAFVQWLLSNQENVASWRSRHAELAASYEDDPEVPRGVAERLASHLALLDLTGELFNEALNLPLTYQSPVRACVASIMENAQQADRPKEALIELVSVAYAQKGRFFGEANYDPASGYIGKRNVETRGHGNCLALTTDFARKQLTEAGHDYYAVTRSWVKRGYCVADSRGKAARCCEIEGSSVRCFCFPHRVISDLMPAA